MAHITIHVKSSPVEQLTVPKPMNDHKNDKYSPWLALWGPVTLPYSRYWLVTTYNQADRSLMFDNCFVMWKKKYKYPLAVATKLKEAFK